jgi:hypothetical protein
MLDGKKGRVQKRLELHHEDGQPSFLNAQLRL